MSGAQASKVCFSASSLHKARAGGGWGSGCSSRAGARSARHHSLASSSSDGGGLQGLSPQRLEQGGGQVALAEGRNDDHLWDVYNDREGRRP